MSDEDNSKVNWTNCTCFKLHTVFYNLYVTLKRENKVICKFLYFSWNYKKTKRVRVRAFLDGFWIPYELG